MNLKSAVPLAAAIAFSLSLSTAIFAQAMDPALAPQTQASDQADLHAQQMVGARASLKESLDAKKVQTGATFHAVLAKKIQLVDGPLLPEGTILTGEVAEDDMQQGEASKLALRFTTATTKDGQTIPIRAMIVGIAPPVPLDASTSVTNEGDQMPNDWTPKTLEIDQINALSGIDLHSKIASKNSGIFVSSKDKPKDVHLEPGSEFALAIAARATTTASR